MKKLLKSAVLAASVAALIPAAQAATATDPFDVVVNLTGACRIVAPGPTDILINHTAFAAATTGTSNFTVQCSQGLLYSVTMPLTSPDNIGGAGVGQLGLTNSVAITAGGDTNVSGTTVGNAHTITASVGALNQAGNCTVANPGFCTATNTYTLTITF